MKLTTAEFEEGEYRGPLFNQLETSHLVWEPGQVFEKHIGVDKAVWCAHHHLLSLYGYKNAPVGVVLPYYDWHYIWSVRKRKKKLPSFRLNLFVQAKRPFYGRFAPKALKEKGLNSPFWRLEITPHQQIALEHLDSNLKGRAIVCYACPAFHKEATLHKWTAEPKMVENSTFPPVSVLKGHAAWNFDGPGTFGVANADPTRIEVPSLFEQLGALLNQQNARDGVASEQLAELAGAVSTAVAEAYDDSSFLRARFSEGLRDIHAIAEDFDLEDGKDEFIAYATVRLFASLHRLNWLVVGHGG